MIQLLKKILRIIDENSWTLRYIFNTHSHADHCGGNNFLQEKSDVITMSSSIEKVLIENPILEPSYLYGAFPQIELHNKFLKAKNSLVNRVLSEGKVDIHGVEFEIIDLPGHSLGMIGLKTDDNVFYLGDSIFPKEIIDKHKLLFLFNYKETIKTLEKLKSYEAKVYVLSHGGIYNDISEIIDYNIASLKGVNDAIYACLDEFSSAEDIHKAVIENYDIKEILPQYYLNISVIKAHLTHLCDSEHIYNEVVDSTVKWKRR
ncbi:MAG: MBL fold metallo-hydrolase [Acidaminobacteraceae bacterium]